VNRIDRHREQQADQTLTTGLPRVGEGVFAVPIGTLTYREWSDL
jgi:hypothetical protein